MRTFEKEDYYLIDTYELMGFNPLTRILDIIDDRIYTIDYEGVMSYDKNFGDIKFIIDNTNTLNNN